MDDRAAAARLDPTPGSTPGSTPVSNLRRLPGRAVVGVVAVEAAAVAIAVIVAPVPPAPRDLFLAVLLVALSVLHTELATGIERTRRRVASSSYFDLSSVWTFAATLLLPLSVAATVILLVYAHLWIRVWLPAKVPLYRHVYTTATVVLAATAAHLVMAQAGGLPGGAEDLVGVTGLALAVLAYAVVNAGLVAVAILLSGSGGVRDLLGRWDDTAVEIATLCMGALAAVALAASPGLVMLALPPILVLHRAVLVRHLEEAASTDAKTGLLNASSWQTQACRAVRRGYRAGADTAVLVLDLDHFKDVNDAYGHLAGDDVLAAVAAQLRAGVRAGDLVGRFGGEEFVVLISGLEPGVAGRAEVAVVAERLRNRIAGVHVAVDTPDGPMTVRGITISIGAALSRTGRSTVLDDMLKSADAALYEAKAGGRNRVRVAGLPSRDRLVADVTAAIPRPRTPSPAGSEIAHDGR